MPTVEGQSLPSLSLGWVFEARDCSIQIKLYMLKCFIQMLSVCFFPQLKKESEFEE